jgi:hypothetical protein
LRKVGSETVIRVGILEALHCREALLGARSQSSPHVTDYLPEPSIHQSRPALILTRRGLSGPFDRASAASYFRGQPKHDCFSPLNQGIDAGQCSTYQKGQ